MKKTKIGLKTNVVVFFTKPYALITSGEAVGRGERSLKLEPVEPRLRSLTNYDKAWLCV